MALLAFAGLIAVLLAPAAQAQGARRGPPPFRPMTIERIEPRRDVAAAEYRSPFCLRWHDGCTDCERPSVTGEVACAPRPEAGPACERHAIVCKQVGGAFGLYCQDYISDIGYLSKGVGGWRGCFRSIEIDAPGLMPRDSMDTFYGRTYGVPPSEIRARDLSGVVCAGARERLLTTRDVARRIRESAKAQRVPVSSVHQCRRF